MSPTNRLHRRIGYALSRIREGVASPFSMQKALALEKFRGDLLEKACAGHQQRYELLAAKNEQLRAALSVQIARNRELLDADAQRKRTAAGGRNG